VTIAVDTIFECHAIMPLMIVPMDKSGRVVLPKAVRDQLQLQAGDEFEVIVDGEMILLRAAQVPSALIDVNGLLVKAAGPRPMPFETIDQALEKTRQSRVKLPVR
jgi:AbrB family looped-hinge helix DNA binding protein